MHLFCFLWFLFCWLWLMCLWMALCWTCGSSALNRIISDIHHTTVSFKFFLWINRKGYPCCGGDLFIHACTDVFLWMALWLWFVSTQQDHMLHLLMPTCLSSSSSGCLRKGCPVVVDIIYLINTNIDECSSALTRIVRYFYRLHLSFKFLLWLYEDGFLTSYLG